ncbi:hypothetical protein GGS24DRAFT_499108 [Hypoxylon argillaceum]|nr:hypothetical protein GGS24DRAFT_499108 [Hypoxylon argillaceum]
MHFTLATLIPLIAAVSAQSWSDIPACAQPCILEAAAATTACGATDYACICASRDVVQAQAEDCVIAACGEDVANNEVLPAVDAACSAL